MLTGANLIGGEDSVSSPQVFRGWDLRTSMPRGPEFHEATADEVSTATRLAAEAFAELSTWSTSRLAELVEACAEALEEIEDSVLETADHETALGVSPRLEGELQRTTAQLRAFGKLARQGWHLEAIIDHAGAGRPDLRRMLVPIGPVAVFGASNFPLAFSVPGGDTASALAAGCPVVVKAHPSHPGTSELCGRAIAEAVRRTGAPKGTFSMVHGTSPEVGSSLVLAPEIRAVGFTGSHSGGMAIHRLGANRPQPIPVYAEMGSLNPVFVTQGALQERGEEIARQYAASMTLGGGQFCTKPGLAFIPDSDNAAFLETLTGELGAMDHFPLLNQQIARTFANALAKSSGLSDVEVVRKAEVSTDGLAYTPGLLKTDLDGYSSHPQLSEEHFGPVSVVVASDPERLVEAAQGLPGSLTATIHAREDEVAELLELQSELLKRVGRVIWNGFPTGVSVVPAMHHGGPFPATNNPASTSVGAMAIRRFLRPVAFQDAPEGALPQALRESNPLRIPRLVDWEWTLP